MLFLISRENKMIDVDVAKLITEPTEINDEYYYSDNIEHGRLVKKFFTELTANMFSQAYEYTEKYKEITKGDNEMPLVFDERNIYSNIAVAINKITPIHLSEWGFNGLQENKRVDFWCLNKNGNSSKAINYFIEVKKDFFYLGDVSKEKFRKNVSTNIQELLKQLQCLKNEVKPEWDGDGNVFLGLSVIHGVHNVNQEIRDNETDVLKNTINNIDFRSKAEIIQATWTIPEKIQKMYYNDEGEQNEYECKFISIIGIVVTKQINQ